MPKQKAEGRKQSKWDLVIETLIYVCAATQLTVTKKLGIESGRVGSEFRWRNLRPSPPALGYDEGPALSVFTSSFSTICIF